MAKIVYGDFTKKKLKTLEQYEKFRYYFFISTYFNVLLTLILISRYI